jgi:hypothetical protein
MRFDDPARRLTAIVWSITSRLHLHGLADEGVAPCSFHRRAAAHGQRETATAPAALPAQPNASELRPIVRVSWYSIHFSSMPSGHHRDLSLRNRAARPALQ